MNDIELVYTLCTLSRIELVYTLCTLSRKDKEGKWKRASGSNMGGRTSERES
jgi:hypothetical protein